MRTLTYGDNIVSRIIGLVLLSLLFILGHAQAAEKKNLTGKPPHASAYDGLLPAGMTPPPAAGFHPSQLRGARVALVPSANFNEWARVWDRWHEEGGEKYKKRGAKLQGSEQGMNPRNFSEQVTQTLQPHVGEIIVAADLLQAHEAGAEYYLILDGWLGTSTLWNTYFIATGGVYLLDGNLQQVFSSQGEAKVKYEEPPLMQSWSTSAWAEIHRRNTMQAVDEMSQQVVFGMQRHLSGSY